VSADEDRIVLEVMDSYKPFVMVLQWNQSKSCSLRGPNHSHTQKDEIMPSPLTHVVKRVICSLRYAPGRKNEAKYAINSRFMGRAGTIVLDLVNP
jgi:hypothetical protein